MNKLQRWLDLVTALLRFRAGLTFDDLAREVPGYAGAIADGASDRDYESVKRTFERDKAELKTFGMPIEVIGAEGEAETRYRIRPSDFYLPYLAITTERGVEHPPRVDAYGYRELTTLTFGPEELLALADGAARARQLGDPALTAEVDSAMRKLAFDLPVDAGMVADEVKLVPSRNAADPATLQSLGDALLARKRVRFSYHSVATGETSARTAEPYGLFFASGHWYLAARDVERDGLRNFRVSRIAAVARENTRAATRDYEIPAGFDLREHARSRQPWELGDGDAMEVVVAVRSESGAVRAAAELGVRSDGAPDEVRYTVRRPDAFARWLLSFAGGMVPVAPESIVREYRDQLARTAALYEVTA